MQAQMNEIKSMLRELEPELVKASARLQKLKVLKYHLTIEYGRLDLELAKIDGRYVTLEPSDGPKPKKPKVIDIGALISALSAEQRLAMLNEMSRWT